MSQENLVEERSRLIQHELRSLPRAAAIASIVFSVLLIIVMAITTRISRVSPDGITTAPVTKQAQTD